MEGKYSGSLQKLDKESSIINSNKVKNKNQLNTNSLNPNTAIIEQLKINKMYGRHSFLQGTHLAFLYIY